VAPKETGVADYVGGFAVTSGIGEEDAIRTHIKVTDDYSRIIAKALADRLAEAFAEALHAKVRRELWGYAKGETLANDDLILEKYQGIRPAPGYPAQPDHTEKATLWKLMNVESEAGIELTESYAMWPGAAVSGPLLLASRKPLLGVGKVERDQAEDYARRKGWTLQEAERWLAPVLNYDPVPGPHERSIGKRLKPPREARVELKIRTPRVEAENGSDIELQVVVGLPPEREASECCGHMAGRIVVPEHGSLDRRGQGLLQCDDETCRGAVCWMTALPIGVDIRFDGRRQ
jgi:hypothetical protein